MALPLAKRGSGGPPLTWRPRSRATSTDGDVCSKRRGERAGIHQLHPARRTGSLGQAAALLDDPAWACRWPTRAQDGRGRLLIAQRRQGDCTSATCARPWSGDAMVRILEYLGHDVIRANHLGDWGTQFGTADRAPAGRRRGHRRAAAVGGEFNAFYQAARAKFDGDPGLRGSVTAPGGPAAGRRRGDPPPVAGSWSTIPSSTTTRSTSGSGSPSPTTTWPRRASTTRCSPTSATSSSDDGIAVISDGALCAFPPGFTGRDGEPLPLILRKSDGGYGYDATDLAAIRYRIWDLQARPAHLRGRRRAVAAPPQMVFAVARQAGWLTDDVSRRARGHRPGRRPGREAAADPQRRVRSS